MYKIVINFDVTVTCFLQIQRGLKKPVVRSPLD